MSDNRAMYRSFRKDIFPERMSLGIGEQTIHYRKVTWNIGEQEKGLRYGDNPGQPAALYKPVDGFITLGEVEFIRPGKGLVTDMELLRSGKHPGKINLTDVDGALGILRYFADEPTVMIMKHNNPCGAASRPELRDAYHEANMSDRLAAFGGAVVLNRSLDRDTAEELIRNYSEVVAAPDFEEGVIDILGRRKDLRVLRIRNMERLENWRTELFPDIRSLCDGGIIVQTSYMSGIRTVKELKREGTFPSEIPERRTEDGKRGETGNRASINRAPSEEEYRDMLFGWLVEAGITSNSVIYVKNRATVGICTGEQDRVGAASIARDKAYRKLRDRIAFEKHGMPYNELSLLYEQENRTDEKTRLSTIMESIEYEVRDRCGGLKGAVMVSDGFFPFRDGIDVGLREGVRAVIQPGGSGRDYESVVACNERDATMIFTGQRAFRH